MSVSEGGAGGGGGGGGGGGADTELKTKTPHVNVGKNPLYAIPKTCKETNDFSDRNEFICNLHKQSQTN